MQTSRKEDERQKRIMASIATGCTTQGCTVGTPHNWPVECLQDCGCHPDWEEHRIACELHPDFPPDCRNCSSDGCPSCRG